MADRYAAELAAEQELGERRYAILRAELAEARRRSGEVVADSADRAHQARWTREAAASTWAGRAARLGAARDGLCLGRLDGTPSDGSSTDGSSTDGTGPVYVGRTGLTGPDGDQLLVDWRAPLARPFYTATPTRPEGLTRRRRFRTRGARILGFHDEPFGPAADVVGPGSGGPSALLDAVEAPRGSGMRDIVGTVQADQDAIIRLPMQGVVLVEGGPGTGKTAVALHRVAYLLYAHRELLERRAVLVVGPNDRFLRWIADVLPGLGEDGAVLVSPGGLHAGVHATQSDPHAAVKGDLAMVDVLARAVADREELPEDPLEVELSDVTVRVDAALVRPARDRARAAGLTHNAARSRFVEALTARVVRAAVREIGEGWLDPGESPQDAAILRDLAEEVVVELKGHEGLAAVCDRLWPALSAEDLLAELYESPERLAAAGADPALYRAAGADWTVEDVPLLDEAVELLGPVPGASERAAAVDRARARYGDAVLRTVAESGVDPAALDGLDPAAEALLTAADLLGADELAARYEGPDVRSAAERAAADREWTFGHVVVDEAQELTPMTWRVLLRRCPTRSITAVGDLAQRSGGPTTWANLLGPALGRRWTRRTLTVNYRTPGAIMELAARLVPGPAPRSLRPGGTPPTIRRVAPAELAAATEREVRAVRARASTPLDGTLSVIAPEGLDLGDPGVPVLTPGEAKGLEFDDVVVVEPGAMAPADLYVALTRATHRLAVLHSEPLPAALEPAP